MRLMQHDAIHEQYNIDQPIRELILRCLTVHGRPKSRFHRWYLYPILRYFYSIEPYTPDEISTDPLSKPVATTLELHLAAEPAPIPAGFEQPSVEPQLASNRS